MMNDLDYMRMAMGLALRAKGETSPNPMVGAVIVRANRVVARGFHRRAGSDHAEIVALKKAKALARGAILYVTLEPCCHHGRTPPCVDQIIEAGVGKVVVGMRDPNPLMNGRSIARLKKSGVKVNVGCLEKELRKINEVFVKYITRQLPFVVTKSAQTLDGKIATVNGQSKWITSAQTRRWTHRLRDEFDAMLVGINTVLKDDPGLHATRKNKRIKKIIMDSHLRLPVKARLLEKTDPRDVIVATTLEAPKSRLRYWQERGVCVLSAPSREGRVDLKWLLRELAKREITSVLIEGGGAVIGSALKEKLVDKMIVAIAPKILGDQKARSAVEGLSPKDINRLVRLKDVTCRNIGCDLLIEGYLN